MQTLIVHSSVNALHLFWLKKIRHVDLHVLNPKTDPWPTGSFDVVIIAEEWLTSLDEKQLELLQRCKLIILGDASKLPEPLVPNLSDAIPKEAQLSVFIKALARVYKQRGGDSVQRLTQETLLIKSDGLFFQLGLDELCCLESMRDYVLFRTNDFRFVVHTTLKNVQHLLSDRPEFIKIHRSYVVNTIKICEKTHNSVMLCDQFYPVSRTNKHKLKYLLF
ncbi:MAG: LytTR family DNA-binding domain-containing protein [Flavobacteriales bacterium]|nr:LytTR family DNA-binding domain-containing protein [Flavobacteriales bacterium]MDG2245826.1 LytTR family DNA-binding domain-containing protein [Flavobacteriales bacterium]